MLAYLMCFMAGCCLMVLIIAPVLVLGPYLLCRWDEYIRAENARRRAARKRIYERARNNG
nr:MAG TPA: voltage-gated potassium channel protein [Caudoviricetes sp.]